MNMNRQERMEMWQEALKEDAQAQSDEIFESNHEGLTEDEWNRMHKNDNRPDDWD